MTPEAVRPLFEKEIEGFAIVFHHAVVPEVGTSTMQSRACGGIANGTYVFCLPGSTGGVKDGWDGILNGSSTAATGPAIWSRSCRG